MSVCPYSGASLLSSSLLVLTAFVESGRKILPPACVKYSASFCVSRAEHGGRIMHCVPCRSGWIYFHTFWTNEIVAAGCLARRWRRHHHHRDRQLVFACWAIPFLLVHQKRSTKREEKENLKWMWMMYPRGTYRPTHTDRYRLYIRRHSHSSVYNFFSFGRVSANWSFSSGYTFITSYEPCALNVLAGRQRVWLLTRNAQIHMHQHRQHTFARRECM